MLESEDWPEGRNEPAPRSRPDGKAAAKARIARHQTWVDLQVRQAMERGDFDNLPGQGKPLGDLGSPDDRDWWLRKLIERERITGVLPAALQLRKDDAELDRVLDREATEKQVRDTVEDFNRRIIAARRQLQGGPPVVTPTRDVEAEVEHWRERRRARLRRRTAQPPAPRTAPARTTTPASEKPKRRWWRRKSRA